MKRSIGLWQWMGFAVTALGGTLLHFLYEWTGGAVWTAAFSGVNESTWEHMKLLFWPMFIYTIIQSFFFRAYPAFFSIKLRGMILGLLLIPIIFYTYNGALGKSPDFVNIAIFFIAAAAAYAYEARLLKDESAPCAHPHLAVIAMCALAILFIVFTFMPPKIPLFKDAVTGAYGIP